MSLRIRRGLSTDIPTPVEGELLYTTDEGKLYVGYNDPEEDEVVPKLVTTDLESEEAPTLSSNLDLNGNNIVGTGNINIDGTITATGNINLGDGVEDNVIVGGQIGSDLIPDTDGLYDIGSSTSSWRAGWFEGIEVNGEINASSIKIENIINVSSSQIYSSSTDTLTISNIDVADVTCDSILSTDSSVIIDGVNKEIYADKIIIDSEISQELNQLEGLTTKNDFFDWSGDLSNWPYHEFQGGLLVDSPYRTENPNGAPRVVLNTFRGDYDSKESLQLGDVVGVLTTQAYIGEPGDEEEVFTSFIGSRVESQSTSENDFPCEIVLSTYDYESNFTEATFSSRGVFAAPVFKVGVFASESERDDQIGTAEKGMIVFNDSTGKFQGYDGTSWVDL